MNWKTHLRSFSHDVLAVARILDQKTATSGVKNRLKLAKNHQKLVPVLGFGWKLIRKGKEHIKKVFSCISKPSCWLVMTFLGPMINVMTKCLNLCQCWAFFSCENRSVTCFETWWADCPPWKEAIALFFIFFLAVLGVPARNFGTISVFGHFLHNSSWDLAEIWPEASLDVSARFPATFPAINEFTFLLVGFACPQLYTDIATPAQHLGLAGTVWVNCSCQAKPNLFHLSTCKLAPTSVFEVSIQWVFAEEGHFN